MQEKSTYSTINLFQLVDSSFPIGGFVYSLGMESAVKNGSLKSNDDVFRYLRTFLEQLMSFDFPFLDAGYEYLNDPLEWAKITHTYEAMLMNPNVQKSSVVLGKNWIKLVCSLYESEKLKGIYQYFTVNKLSFHQVVVLGLGCAALGVEQKSLREMYVYTSLRDQISALTRLGTIGPQGGQSLLTKLLDDASVKLVSYEQKHYEEATKSAYLLEIIQLKHDKIYSKLFQN